MGLTAAARVGIGLPSVADRTAGGFVSQVRADVATAVADPRVALIEGTAILWSRDDRPLRGGAAPSFPVWNADVGPSLLQRVQRDGGVSVPPGTTGAERAEQTALVLLGLELAYRTY